MRILKMLFALLFACSLSIDATELRRVKLMGELDANNSTSTPLAGAATFTGAATDVLDYGIIFVNVYTDVVSATDGLAIEQSSDGTNWDHDDVYTVPAGGAKNYSINPYARYVRVVYTNGAGAQSAFRLQTIIKGNSKPSSHRIQDTITDEDDAELVKSILTAKANGGGFLNIEATTDGNLRVANVEDGLSIAKGDVTGSYLIHKFGRNDAVPNGTWELVSLLSTTVSYLSAPTTVRVKAGSIGDSAAGIGARSITVVGIAADLTEKNEDIATAGASASSPTTETFWQVYRAYVSDESCGTFAGSNIGQVIIENGAGGTDLISIAAGEGQSQYSRVASPAGVKLYLTSLVVTVNSLKAADIKLMMLRNFHDTTVPTEPVRIVKQWGGVLGDMTIPIDFPNEFDPLTDIWIEARGGGAATDVTADMEFVAVIQ